MARYSTWATAGVVAGGLLLGGLSPVSAEQVPLPVPTVTIAQDVPAAGVELASKSGRYVISGNALFDRQTQRTLKRFTGRVRSITDDGRYVTYIVDGPAGKAPFVVARKRCEESAGPRAIGPSVMPVVGRPALLEAHVRPPSVDFWTVIRCVA